MSESSAVVEKSLRSVFVGNIPYEATEEKLCGIFGQVGPVLSFKLMYDRETGKPKGYGFCEYKDQETALSAMRNLNGYEIAGRPLRVDNACTEKSRMEMQSLMMGPVVESPFGPEVEPAKAPEAISNAVASLPPEQMYELMRQMKLCVRNNPAEARTMLMNNPQLAYALLQAQVVMRIVDPKTAVQILHGSRDEVETLVPLKNGPPVPPPQTPTASQNSMTGPPPSVPSQIRPPVGQLPSLNGGPPMPMPSMGSAPPNQNRFPPPVGGPGGPSFSHQGPPRMPPQPFQGGDYDLRQGGLNGPPGMGGPRAPGPMPSSLPGDQDMRLPPSSMGGGASQHENYRPMDHDVRYSRDSRNDFDARVDPRNEQRDHRYRGDNYQARGDSWDSRNERPYRDERRGNDQDRGRDRDYRDARGSGGSRFNQDKDFRSNPGPPQPVPSPRSGGLPQFPSGLAGQDQEKITTDVE